MPVLHVSLPLSLRVECKFPAKLSWYKCLLERWLVKPFKYKRHKAFRWPRFLQVWVQVKPSPLHLLHRKLCKPKWCKRRWWKQMWSREGMEEIVQEMTRASLEIWRMSQNQQLIMAHLDLENEWCPHPPKKNLKKTRLKEFPKLPNFETQLCLEHQVISRAYLTWRGLRTLTHLGLVFALQTQGRQKQQLFNYFDLRMAKQCFKYPVLRSVVRIFGVLWWLTLIESIGDLKMFW